MRASVTFIGNATTVVRLGGFTLLTDPAFGPAGSRAYLGYGAHDLSLAEIVRRFGEIGAVLVHLGTRILGMVLTMVDRQGVALTRLFRPRLRVPMHFDDYRVMKSPLSDLLSRAREQSLTAIQPVTAATP